MSLLFLSINFMFVSMILNALAPTDSLPIEVPVLEKGGEEQDPDRSEAVLQTWHVLMPSQQYLPAARALVTSVRLHQTYELQCTWGDLLLWKRSPYPQNISQVAPMWVLRTACLLQPFVKAVPLLSFKTASLHFYSHVHLCHARYRVKTWIKPAARFRIFNPVCGHTLWTLPYILKDSKLGELLSCSLHTSSWKLDKYQVLHFTKFSRDTFQKTEPLNSCFRLSTLVISCTIQDIKMNINRNGTSAQTRRYLLSALHPAVSLDCQILALSHRGSEEPGANDQSPPRL